MVTRQVPVPNCRSDLHRTRRHPVSSCALPLFLPPVSCVCSSLCCASPSFVLVPLFVPPLCCVTGTGTSRSALGLCVSPPVVTATLEPTTPVEGHANNKHNARHTRKNNTKRGWTWETERRARQSELVATVHSTPDADSSGGSTEHPCS